MRARLADCQLLQAIARHGRGTLLGDVEPAPSCRAYPRSPSGIEFRGADPSANPYLCIAGLLLAGADGIDGRLELEPPEDESIGGFDPTGDSVRYRPLPRALDDALDALLGDDVLVDGFDDALLQRLVDGRRIEAAEYRQHVTQWEFERYLDA